MSLFSNGDEAGSSRPTQEFNAPDAIGNVSESEGDRDRKRRSSLAGTSGPKSRKRSQYRSDSDNVEASSSNGGNGGAKRQRRTLLNDDDLTREELAITLKRRLRAGDHRGRSVSVPVSGGAGDFAFPLPASSSPPAPTPTSNGNSQPPGPAPDPTDDGRIGPSGQSQPPHNDEHEAGNSLNLSGLTGSSAQDSQDVIYYPSSESSSALTLDDSAPLVSLVPFRRENNPARSILSSSRRSEPCRARRQLIFSPSDALPPNYWDREV